MNEQTSLSLDLRLAPAATLGRTELERVRSDLIARLATLKPRSRERIVMEGKLAEITLYLLRRR